MTQRKCYAAELLLVVVIVLMHFKILPFQYTLLVRHLLFFLMVLIGVNVISKYEKYIYEFKTNRHNDLK